MPEISYPQGNVFYRRMAHDHPIISRCDGVFLFDESGMRYLDGSGGALVVNAGHGIESIADVMCQQAAQAAYIHSTMFTSEAIERYAAELGKITPLPDARFYFLTSGSEAIEAASKLARQIQIARGEEQRYITISRWMSFHGATLGALALTGKAKMRKHFQVMFKDMPHIPPPYCYRCPFGLNIPGCDLRCATILETEIKRVGAENVSAFIAESVSGATLGAVVPPAKYWPRIREICDQYGVLLIADEVMSGMGRTGNWFAIEGWDVMPDIITMGKGTTSGYFPLSVVAVRGEFFDLIANRTGDFIHGGTFSHHAVGAATGLATLEYIASRNLLEAATEQGKYLGEKLQSEMNNLACVGDIRGVGLMWGVEFVKETISKAPFNPQFHFSHKVADEAFRRGLIIYPGSGCVDGLAGDLIMIGPPFIISKDQIDEIVDILCHSVIKVFDDHS
jgi:adenosylmethionine-8-amino-7-oxononanoate aminotransferase